MTQEEKAKRYDEVLEIAKKNYVTAQDLCEGSQMGVECFKNTLESIFPELKSEDERIKKEIIEYIKTGTYHKKWIAWLEKQGKETSWKPSKEEMDVLYGLAYITNKYDEHKEEVITRLYQDLKREFFNGSSYENMFPNTENGVRRRSTIQVLEYARSLDNFNQYGKADIDKNIAWLEKQGEKDKLIRELGEYKVKYIQETLGKALTMNNKDDERIRKTTIAFLKDFADKGYENAVECIDWLEKQCEQFDDNIITSSDERIRKAILEGLIDCRDAPDLGWSNFGGIEIDDCIAWLEKQDNFSNKDIDNAYLKGVTDTKNEIEKQYEANYQIRKDIATFIFNYKGVIKDRAKWMNYLGIKVSFVEKQGEKPQGKSAIEAIREEKVDNANKIEPKDYSSIDPHFGKPIDKNEPKFKVGDIVQYITDSTDRRKIEEIDTLCNMYHTDSLPIIFDVEDEWKVYAQ